MRRIRRISQNTFNLQCDIKPYLETYQQSLSKFENSLMLMQILKKHEKLMFQDKQKQVQYTISNFEQQNQLLVKIKQKLNFSTIKKEKALASSFKVLQELDVNRKHAYQILEQQNKQIADRIYALETALQRMTNAKKSYSLSNQYLQKLKNKVEKRKKFVERLTKLIEEVQQKNQEQIDSSKKIIKQILIKKYGNTDNNKSTKKKNSDYEQVQNLLQTIFSTLND